LKVKAESYRTTAEAVQSLQNNKRLRKTLRGLDISVFNTQNKYVFDFVGFLVEGGFVHSDIEPRLSRHGGVICHGDCVRG
jgi:hypothetical protein